MSTTPDFRTLRDQWALKFPYPSPADIQHQQTLDINRNPHNDDHKPQRRSVATIVSDLSYNFANEVLSAQYPFKYKEWLKENCYEVVKGQMVNVAHLNT